MKLLRVTIALTALFLLLGPCAYAVMTDMAPTVTPTTEASELLARARPKKGEVLPVDGKATGYKWNFAGRFNWRGKYKGPYMTMKYISKSYAYTKNGVDYYPAVERDGRFKGWYVRDKDTVNRITWKDSRVTLY
ncbi:MAG: hypothetical protein GWN93_06150 [Deltaproteobacteria bacterium]|nr:hypothetical protein [Deltaproteobacteria bacterium]